jgi:hypothetical protein
MKKAAERLPTFSKAIIMIPGVGRTTLRGDRGERVVEEFTTKGGSGKGRNFSYIA